MKYLIDQLKDSTKEALIDILRGAPITCQPARCINKLVKLGILEKEKDFDESRALSVNNEAQLKELLSISDVDKVDVTLYALDHCTPVQVKGVYNYVLQDRSEEPIVISSRGFDSKALFRKGVLIKHGRRAYKPTSDVLDKWDDWLKSRPDMQALLAEYQPRVRKQRQIKPASGSEGWTDDGSYVSPIPQPDRPQTVAEKWRDKRMELGQVSQKTLDEAFAVFLHNERGVA